MHYIIAKTLEEKKQIAIYYENIRKEMEKIREEFDEIEENKYNNKMLERIKNYNNETISENISIINQ